ncbi:MAG: dihydroxyacetone kinase subunit L [Nonomuraea sp.]|nr:dihydroxyacetone kinase subunit L [Nonomuraea sp.]
MERDAALAWVAEIARSVSAARERLTELDAAIGDADHGANLDRGFTEVTAALATPPETAGEVLALTGVTLIRKVGGASGPLYGSFFRALGKHVGDSADFAAAFADGVAAVQRLGKAEPGDKTMLDALLPAAAALAEGTDPATAARVGAKATIPLQARKGRASYLGERSVGHEDPGAASAALIVAALVATWQGS